MQKPGRAYSQKIRKDGKPYRRRASTYVQGTLLKLLDFHLERNDLLVSPYLRGLLKDDLQKRYEITPAKGIIRLPKQQ